MADAIDAIKDKIWVGVRLKEFYDKNTNELYKIGDEIQVNKARGEELLANKLELVS